MPTATAESATPNWADLPFDLVGNISSRLHAATDYVRFHATCLPWRDTLPPATCRPAFLPWILSPRDATTGHRKARCVFSAKSSRRAAATTEILVRDRRWVIGADGGASACLINTTRPQSSIAVDPLTGSAASIPLPRCEDETMKTWGKRAIGVVSGDGTIIFYAYGPVTNEYGHSFHVALLRPGDAAWTFVQRGDVYMPSESWRCCCVAYRRGRILMCHDRWWWLLRLETEPGMWHRREGWEPDEPCKVSVSNYLVESQGEILWAFVQVNAEYYHRKVWIQGVGLLEDLTDALSVSVYMLKEDEGREPEWVKKDGLSLVDRVLFLGRPRSFAMDASQFGFSSGCAYFVVRSEVYGGIWSKSAVKRCRLFRYSFHDGKSEFIEQLPDDWNHNDCMWLTPQPALATTEEIRGRVEALNPKAGVSHGQIGTYFRIHVGNLPRMVDSYQLRQFFSKYGKVADARVMCGKGTRRSRGFGFVTMATHVDEEPRDTIARLHGQSLDGHILRVKFAHQEGDG
nr:unnamed protein product [Digitaria exilis]